MRRLARDATAIRVTGTRHDYARQAALYDDTRSASPSIVSPLLRGEAAALPLGDGIVVAWRKP